MTETVANVFETPHWNAWLPKGAPRVRNISPIPSSDLTVVYFPTCANRVLGGVKGSKPLHESILSVLTKARISVKFPEKLSNLCCGMAFESRGFFSVSTEKTREIIEILEKASEGGKHPILVDMSPCWMHLKENAHASKLEILDPAKFISKYLSHRLTYKKKDEILIHVPCTSKRSGISKTFIEVAKQCADTVHQTEIPCCGMSGDRGLYFPELPASAIEASGINKRHAIKNCKEGYSSSRTCEIALSLNTLVPYKSLFHLIDECTDHLKVTL